jgi:hypothetical protein
MCRRRARRAAGRSDGGSLSSAGGLITMGQHIELTAAALLATERHSYRHLWSRVIAPHLGQALFHPVVK